MSVMHNGFTEFELMLIESAIKNKISNNGGFLSIKAYEKLLRKVDKMLEEDKRKNKELTQAIIYKIETIMRQEFCK